MSDFKCFGLAKIKAEGCAMHPDELNPCMSDEKYIKQLKAYLDGTGHKNCFCCRPELLEKALSNG